MKFFAILCLIAAAVAAPAPQQDPRYADITVLRDDRDVRTDGFSYNLETSDGTKLSQVGTPLADSGALVKTGTIEWVMPDGELFTLTYIADENGYRVESPFVPTK